MLLRASAKLVPLLFQTHLFRKFLSLLPSLSTLSLLDLFPPLSFQTIKTLQQALYQPQAGQQAPSRQLVLLPTKQSHLRLLELPSSNPLTRPQQPLLHLQPLRTVPPLPRNLSRPPLLPSATTVSAAAQTARPAEVIPTPSAGSSSAAPSSLAGAAMMSGPAVLAATARVENVGSRGMVYMAADVYILGR